MNVTVSVGGRYHAFDLAAQLEKRGLLRQLITSYPRFKAMEWSIPRGQITSLLSCELLNRCSQKLPYRFSSNLQTWITDRYDRYAAEVIHKNSDIFVGWSSMSLHSIRTAKKYGSVTIVERGSSHILHQTDILTEEYGRLGLPAMVAHPRIVGKELAEYDEADYISIPSSYVRQTFIDRGVPNRKLIQGAYGVNLAHFKPIPRQDDIFRVIHCGGITLRKGVHYLLQAFHELNLKRAELRLIGTSSPEMERFWVKYRHPGIRLMGTFPQAELHKHYSQGSLFCLASIEEGMAMVIPQAMACGLPVICTANTGGGDIVRNAIDGFVIPIRDVEALKEKLTFLYEHRDICREMGRSARERVETGFTWDNYGEQMVGHYRHVLGERRADRGVPSEPIHDLLPRP